MSSLFVDGHGPIGIPYWWEHGAARPELPTTVPEKAELAIIGAGYTGLSAAIAAHDAGAKVVVIDADIPGAGASTRNGGMFGAHPRLSFDKLTSQFGEAAASGVYNEAIPAFDFTQQLIVNENIACQFQQTGRIQLAWSQKDLVGQRQLVAEIAARTTQSLSMVDRQEMLNDINTDLFFGGMRLPDHAAVHPRQFHDGLLAAVLRRGITVVQRSPVVSIQRLQGHFELRCHGENTPASSQQSRSELQLALGQLRAVTDYTASTLRADKVLMASNGYTCGDFNWHQRRVFPLPSFIIATEPLPAEQLQRLAPGRRMMVETRGRHSYFRVSPDGTRILFGGRAAMRNTTAQLAANTLHKTLCEVWPELNDVKLSHSWFGQTGYTFTHMPYVGEHNGVHFSMGYSGSGVVMAPYLGMKSAYRALGDERGETAYAQTPFNAQWHYRGGKPYFLSLAQFWYDHVVDKVELAVAARDRRASASSNSNSN